jgi:hypothetical protein
VTTGNSPLSRLKRQADEIAKNLKAIERGESLPSDPLGRIAASRVRGVFKFGMVMDDKTIIVEIPWRTIERTSEVALAEFILKQTKNVRDSHH